MRASILLPSYGRPQQLRNCVQNILDTATGDYEVIVILDRDYASEEAVHDLPVRIAMRPERDTCISAWNYGAALASGDAFVAAADDFYFYKDWLSAAVVELFKWQDLQGLVALNDLHHGPDELATIFLLTRKYAVENLGGVIYCPQYKSFFCDNEITERAKRDGKWVWSKTSVAEHRHWANGKAVRDATYDDREQYWEHDREVWSRRRAASFPNNFSPSFGMLS